MSILAGGIAEAGTKGHIFKPITVNVPPSRRRPTLKAVVFNAAGGRYFSEIVERLRRPPLQDADVIFLCEADWRLGRSNGREFAADLAKELGMSFTFIAEFGTPLSLGEPQGFVGNAILSTQPLDYVYAVPLPSLHINRRLLRLVGSPCGLVAKANFNGRSISLGVAHLNSRIDPVGRDQQMTAYLANFPAQGAAIIGGDFNTTTLSLRSWNEVLKSVKCLVMQPWRLRRPETLEPLFQRLAEAKFKLRDANVLGKSTFTFSGMIPPLIRPKLDWIAPRMLKAVPRSAAVVRAHSVPFARRISDHDFVVCDFHV